MNAKTHRHPHPASGGYLLPPPRRLLLWLALLSALPTPGNSAQPQPPPPPTGAPAIALTSAHLPAGTINLSLRHEIDAAIQRGFAWLATRQKPDGSWSDNPNPALTALPLWAFARGQAPTRDQVLDRAITNLVSRRQPDGGIYAAAKGQLPGSLSVYNTAVCLTALSATDREALAPVILAARAFIAGAQHFGSDDYQGGFGYDRASGRPYTDMLTTLHAAQAMRSSEAWEQHRPAAETRADLDWTETASQVERLQSALHAELTADTPAPAPGDKLPATRPLYFRSYGSMTYAGMLALIYASVTSDDTRVRSALEWAEQHWTLDENPGMGPQGLFFFYNVLSRTLNASGVDFIRLHDGSFLNWREALGRRLVSLQQIDPKTGAGYWRNDAGQYWEDDPVLVTAYALLALLAL